MRKILLLLSMAVALGAVGCGDDESPAAGNCFDYSSFEGASPATAFRADVLPIFQRSCGVSGSSCHGSETGPSNRPYLGPSLGPMVTDAQITAIFAQNVNVDATIEPGMKRIAPSDPANSFLLHKIDNTLECEDLTCASDKSCLTPMPQGSELPQGERDTIRRWIAQGAQNN